MADLSSLYDALKARMTPDKSTGPTPTLLDANLPGSYELVGKLIETLRGLPQAARDMDAKEAAFNDSIRDLPRGEQIKASMKYLGELGLDPMSFGPSNMGGAMAGIFAGGRALTADRTLLREALVRLAKGEHPDDVRKVTGWEHGVDGNPRFEISDDTAKWRYADPTTGMPLQHVEMALDRALDHPELFKAYPQLRQMTLEYRPMMGDSAEVANGHRRRRERGRGGRAGAPRLCARIVNVEKLG